MCMMTQHVPSAPYFQGSPGAGGRLLRTVAAMHHMLCRASKEVTDVRERARSLMEEKDAQLQAARVSRLSWAMSLSFICMSVICKDTLYICK